MRIGVPAYFAPAWARGDWERLAALPAGAIVIINPGGGPPEEIAADYAMAVDAVQAAGVLVYGYVAYGYGRVPGGTILAAIGTYRDRLGLDGVFIDQAPPGGAALSRLARLVEPARDAGVRLAVNPGLPFLDPRALEWFDEVVAFEGDWQAYRAVHAVIAALPRTGSTWHLVYGVPAADIPAVAAQALALGAEIVFVTDHTLPNPWHALPAGWEVLIAAARRPPVTSGLSVPGDQRGS